MLSPLENSKNLDKEDLINFQSKCMSKERAIIFILNGSSGGLPWREHLWWHLGKHYSFDVQNKGGRKWETKGMCTGWRLSCGSASLQ